MGVLTYKGTQFYLDGEPFVVISGTMHYFRIPRAYWHDRLLKLKECGFNTVETYTCWNLHELREGEFDFSGNLDIAAYIAEAAKVGLHVILRPGPYICAEWEFGGLPSWLLNYENMPLRCYDEQFLSKLRPYYNELLGRVRPYLASKGGPIFMLQIENEYGSYGDDKDYLRAIVDLYKENGMDCLFFTSDGPSYTMLSGGTLPEYLAVANFGSAPKSQLAIMSELYPDRPLMCGEFWSGWFDHWHEEHHVRPAEEIVQCVREFAELGASFNFYMFHGGTNFGFTNGANHPGTYQPTITSYDYNAPLSEAGDRTETYYRLREILEERYGKAPALTAKETEKAAYGKLTLTEEALLFENLDKLSAPIKVVEPKYMEEIGQAFGYVLYRTTIPGPKNDWPMAAAVVHDRAQIWVNGEKQATWERWDKEGIDKQLVRMPLGVGENGHLDILVENMGRVNYGPKLRDRKGIHGVRFGGQHHFGWEMYPLPMTDLSRLAYRPAEGGAIEGPVFLRGSLVIEGQPKDTFLRLDGFTKGFVMVNGINIGRYFNPAGPQKTLYVPAPYLREGENEIVVFESDATAGTTVEFFAEPDLG
ncbi:MAG: beta-galactosidase [Clostridia bacterium]|nr:beta-galactosidase [Clostridia bacterium]